MDTGKIKRVFLIAALLIAAIISLLSMGDAIHNKKLNDEEKNKYGKVIEKNNKYSLIYYTDNINVSVNKFPESIKKAFTCKDKNCGIIKTGGIYAVIYDNFKYYIYDTKKQEILYKTSKMRDVNFSILASQNGNLVDNVFIVYKDINNRSCLYNIRKRKITITGDYKKINYNYTNEYQPNYYYVTTENNDGTYSVINYNSGYVTLTYNNMYCANDNYCVIDNNYVYDFSNESYVIKKNIYHNIYMATKDNIAIDDGTNVYLINNEGKRIDKLFSLNEYKDYNIKSYFNVDDNNVMYMIFEFYKNNKLDFTYSYNLKDLKNEKIENKD